MTSEKEKCRYFETCSAALCPLDERVKLHRWYPDPDIEICKMKKGPSWIKTQNKILKAGSSPHLYFTVDMLEMIKRVRTEIYGISDRKPYKTAFNDWKSDRENRHPHQRPLKKRCDKTGFSGVFINGEAFLFEGQADTLQNRK